MNFLFIASISFRNYLFPENPLSKTIVVFLVCVFIIWFLGIIVSARWIWSKRRDMEKFKDVSFLEREKNPQAQIANEDSETEQTSSESDTNESDTNIEVSER